MAKVILTLEDESNGEVSLRTEFDPPIPEDATAASEISPATSVGIIMYMAACEASKD